MSQTLTEAPLRVAVITGHHPFEVPPFQDLFRDLPSVQPYFLPLEDFGADVGDVRDTYNVLVFYNMHKATPGGEEEWFERGTAEALGAVGQTPQGVVVLHHGLLAFPRWDKWDQVVGLSDRTIDGYHFGQTVPVHVADVEHPICRGLSDWQIVDETYKMVSAAGGNHVLLTTDHPQSSPTLAWTHPYGQARVFSLQLGHDARAFGDPNFRTVLHRGIRWAGRRI